MLTIAGGILLALFLLRYGWILIGLAIWGLIIGMIGSSLGWELCLKILGGTMAVLFVLAIPAYIKSCRDDYRELNKRAPLDPWGVRFCQGLCAMIALVLVCGFAVNAAHHYFG